MSLVEGHRQVTDRHVRTQLLRADRRARRHRRPARDTGWPVGWQFMGATELPELPTYQPPAETLTVTLYNGQGLYSLTLPVMPPGKLMIITGS